MCLTTPNLRILRKSKSLFHAQLPSRYHFLYDFQRQMSDRHCCLLNHQSHWVIVWKCSTHHPCSKLRSDPQQSNWNCRTIPNLYDVFAGSTCIFMATLPSCTHDRIEDLFLGWDSYDTCILIATSSYCIKVEFKVSTSGSWMKAG